MVLSTGGAWPLGFPAKVLVHDAAGGAGLAAGVLLVCFHNAGAVPLGLVAYLPEQIGHCGVGEGLGLQAGPDHAGDVEGLDAQGVILPHEGPADLVVGVVSEPFDAALDGVDALLGLVPAPVLGDFAFQDLLPGGFAAGASGLGPLPTPEFPEGQVEGPGVLVGRAAAVDGEGLMPTSAPPAD